MAGNRIGGLKAAAKNKANNPNFYKEIGAIGGSKSTTGGFYANRELARTAGRKGGLKGGKRTPKAPEQPKKSLLARIFK